MAKSPMDELNELNAKEEFPIRIALGNDGKTMVVIDKCKSQAFLSGRIQKVLGNPEFEGFTEDYPNKYVMVFPHQNLPESFLPLITVDDRGT